MKRYRVKIAYLLLAVYLPMWLFASFHVHTDASAHGCVTHERHASDFEDGDDCLLCQFQQLFYEETPQVSVSVCLPEVVVETVSVEISVLSVSEQKFSPRAPPVLL